MAPEREVSEEQLRAVRDWIYDIKGGKFVRNLYPGTENGVWDIDGEPIVVYGEDNPIYDEHGDFDGFGLSKHHLLCSDKHAKELEETGIISFSEAEVSER